MRTTSAGYYVYLIVFLGLLSAFGPFVIDMYPSGIAGNDRGV